MTADVVNNAAELTAKIGMQINAYPVPERIEGNPARREERKLGIGG